MEAILLLAAAAAAAAVAEDGMQHRLCFRWIVCASWKRSTADACASELHSAVDRCSGLQEVPDPRQKNEHCRVFA